MEASDHALAMYCGERITGQPETIAVSTHKDPDTSLVLTPAKAWFGDHKRSRHSG
jgi:hypothetical protein